jgi:addiction module HigA family antidote
MSFKAPLPHPGTILRMEFLEPYGLTAGALARRMKLKDRSRIERLARAQGTITPDTALRLARVFDGTDPQFWMNLQTQHDLSVAELKAEDLDAIEPVAA